MTRKRLNLSLIPNSTARKVSFKERKSSILKKVYELSKLCDVEAFMIICSPYDSEPTVWPSHQEVQKRLDKHRNRSGNQHIKNVVNHEDHLRTMTSQMKDHSKKQVEFNKIMETQYLMYQVSQGSDEIDSLELSEKYAALGMLLDKIKAIRIRMDHLHGVPQSLPPSNFGHPLEVETSQPRENVIGAVNNIANNWLEGQWTTCMMNDRSNKNGMGLPRVSITIHAPEIEVRHQDNDVRSYVVTPSNIIGPQLANQALAGDNKDKNVCRPLWDPYGSVSETSTMLRQPSYSNVTGGDNDFYSIGSSGSSHYGNLGKRCTFRANIEQRLGFERNAE